MGFPTKNDDFGVFLGGTAIYGNTHIDSNACFFSIAMLVSGGVAVVIFSFIYF